MSDENQPYTSEKSYLIADCGHALTKLVLFDVAAGSYRLIAHTAVQTTVGEPWLDIRVGLQNGIRQIATITGRQLLDAHDNIITPANIDGSGVDYFTIVVSSAPLLRTILGGLFNHVSLAKAHHVMMTNYTNIVDVFSLSDQREKGEQIASIVQNRPDLILIAGGTNNGARDRLIELVDTIALGAEEIELDWRPNVVFAGNETIHETIQARFQDVGNLHLTSNLQPNLAQEQLDEAVELLSEMYRVLKINQIPGIREVNDWSRARATATVSALTKIVAYLATSQQQRFFCVDLGSSSLTMVYADPTQTKTTVNAQLGMGASLSNLSQHITPSDINRWLPSSIDDQEIIDFIYQRSLHPQTIATLEKEILLEQAISRELIRFEIGKVAQSWGWATEDQLPPIDAIIIRGSLFTHAPRYGPIILSLLDALQPTGIFSLSLDKYNILPALGKLTTIDPLVIVQTLENGVLPLLAWVIAPKGTGKLNQKALTVQVDSTSPKLPEVEVEFGAIEVLPLPPDVPAKVTIKPTRRFDIGAGMGKSITVTINGGLFGLVIDARGRPLTPPQKESDQHSFMRQWLREVGG